MKIKRILKEMTEAPVEAKLLELVVWFLQQLRRCPRVLTDLQHFHVV